MKKYSILYTIAALFILLIFSTEGLCFAGAADIKARMQQRLPTIVQLKSEGVVGENNLGYLEFVPGAAQKMGNIVAEENSDRKMVYEAIAKQQNTTADLVGKRRAIQIGQRAAAGEWLQNDSGKWYKK
ncbi:MAG: YdbL family protein [Desulfobulbales bacterium]